MSLKNTFPVVISSPDEVIWQGDAISISAENSAGKFDILPEHANFVTFVNPDSQIVIRMEKKDANVFSYKDAVIAVKSGKVDVYTGL